MEQYDDNALRQYLLGGLQEGERGEALDELSIVDDEFAARMEAVESDLIDAYIRGQLDGRERTQFELQYLASPHQREKVKFAQSFQSFAEKKLMVNAAGTAVVVETPVQESHVVEPEPVRQVVAESARWWRSVQAPFTIPNMRLQWGLATAALLLLATGSWLALETSRLRSQMDQAQAERTALKQLEAELQTQLGQERSAGLKTTRELARVREQLAGLEQQVIAQQRAQQQPSLPAELNIAHFDLAPQMRNRSVAITIPPGTDYVTLQLELDTDDYPAYRAELRTQTGGEKVWGSSRLGTKAKGQHRVLDVSIRADKLKARGYTLMLKGIAKDGSEQDEPSYAFRVVK